MRDKSSVLLEALKQLPDPTFSSTSPSFTPFAPAPGLLCPKSSAVGPNGAGYTWDARESPQDLDRFSIAPPCNL